MGHAVVLADQVTYGAVSFALLHGRQWSYAVHLVKTSVQIPVGVDSIVLDSVIEACRRSGHAYVTHRVMADMSLDWYQWPQSVQENCRWLLMHTMDTSVVRTHWWLNSALQRASVDVPRTTTQGSP